MSAGSESPRIGGVWQRLSLLAQVLEPAYVVGAGSMSPKGGDQAALELPGQGPWASLCGGC